MNSLTIITQDIASPPLGTVVLDKIFQAVTVFLSGHEVTAKAATLYWLADTNTQVAASVLFRTMRFRHATATKVGGVALVTDALEALVSVFIFAGMCACLPVYVGGCGCAWVCVCVWVDVGRMCCKCVILLVNDTGV